MIDIYGGWQCCSGSLDIHIKFSSFLSPIGPPTLVLIYLHITNYRLSLSFFFFNSSLVKNDDSDMKFVLPLIHFGDSCWLFFGANNFITTIISQRSFTTLYWSNQFKQNNSLRFLVKCFTWIIKIMVKLTWYLWSNLIWV